MSDTFEGIGDLFGAAADIFGGNAKASGYKKAAAFATANASLTKSAGDIELLRQKWAALKSFGSTKAAFAANGVRSDTGGALDVLAEAHRNAALDAQLIRTQTEVGVNTYQAEAASYSSQAAAAKGGGILGAITGIFKAAVAFGT